MKQRLAPMVLVALLVGACATSPCPEGAEEQVVRGTSYCVGRFSGVIITGFCRGSHPFELDLEGGIVCSQTPLDPSALPDEVCAVLDGRCAPLTRPLATGGWAPLPALPAPRASGAFCDPSMIVVVGGSQSGGARALGAAALRATASGWSATWDELDGIVQFGGGGVAFGDDTVLVYGDDAEDPPSLVARAYDRTTLAGRDVTVGAPSARMETEPAFEDGRFVVFGGRARYATTAFGDGAFFEPASGTWVSTPTEGAPTARSRHVTVADHVGHVLIWGGSAQRTGSASGDGVVLDLPTNRWFPIMASDAPTPRVDAMAGFATSEEGALGWVIWGGTSASGAALRDGAILAPGRTTWTPIALEGAPSRVPNQVGVVAGHWLFVVGGTSTDGYLPIVAYDFITGAWYGLPPGPTARVAPAVCAIGQSIIVVGGIDSDRRYLDDAWEWQP